MSSDEDRPSQADLEQEAFEKLGNQSAGDVLKQAGENLIKRLAARVELGIASKEDQALLAKMLKDSGLTFNSQPDAPPPAASEPADLPDLGRPDYE